MTLQNNSGTAFTNAQLQLVAGDLHKAEDDRGRGPPSPRKPCGWPRSRDEMTQQAFADTTSTRWGAARRCATPKPSSWRCCTAGVPVPSATSWTGQQFGTTATASVRALPIKDTVKVFYDFKNAAASRLGMPLPAGIVRVYQTDRER